MIGRAFARAYGLLRASIAGAAPRLTDKLVDYAVWAVVIFIAGAALTVARVLLGLEGEAEAPAVQDSGVRASATYDDGFVERKDGGPGFASLDPMIAHLRENGVPVEWTIAAPTVYYCRPLTRGPLETDALLDRLSEAFPDCLVVQRSAAGITLSPHQGAYGPVPVKPAGTDAYFCGCVLPDGGMDRDSVNRVRLQRNTLYP